MAPSTEWDLILYELMIIRLPTKVYWTPRIPIHPAEHNCACENAVHWNRKQTSKTWRNSKRRIFHLCLSYITREMCTFESESKHLCIAVCILQGITKSLCIWEWVQTTRAMSALFVMQSMDGWKNDPIEYSVCWLASCMLCVSWGSLSCNTSPGETKRWKSLCLQQRARR